MLYLLIIIINIKLIFHILIVLFIFTNTNFSILCTNCNNIFPVKNNSNIEQTKITFSILQNMYLTGFILIKVKLQVVIFFTESVFIFNKLILANFPLSSPIYNINSDSKLQHILVISLLLKKMFWGSICKKLNVSANMFKIN